MTKPQKKRPAQKATKAEMRERLMQVEEMLAKGWRHTLIVATMKANYPIGTKAIEKLVSRIYKKWADADSKVDKAEKRRRQVNRLHAMLEDKTKTITPTERVRVETLIAKIEGTLAPIEVGGINQEPINVTICDYRGSEQPSEVE